jgi:ubiquinone/menaquinone biosynthesis C-methylase UbiE
MSRNPNSDSRSFERLREHYLIEKELADRLRNSTRTQRRQAYQTVYDELFRRVPDHPQLTLKRDAFSRHQEVSQRMRLLKHYLHPDATYLEIGAGDCALAIEVAKHVRKVYAVDVSEEIGKGVALPGNVELIISDGCSIPVTENSINLAYSDQLMEHLHPDDAMDQLQNIYKALAPGGVYICITPNRLSGPHDVSQYFDQVATGFHLKEYTFAELAGIFRVVGFRKFQALSGARGLYLRVPTILPQALELLLQTSGRFGRKLARRLPLRLILGVKLIAWK